MADTSSPPPSTGTTGPVSRSSRVIIKNLPSTRFTDKDLRKHVSSFCEVTDCRLLVDRRIAFVGFKTADDAERAVKHFNRSYIRTSKLAVEIAKTVKDERSQRRRDAPLSSTSSNKVALGDPSKKRKRGEEELSSKLIAKEKPLLDENDPKLKEYLNVMQPSSKSKTWANEVPLVEERTDTGMVGIVEVENESDDEYASLPEKAKKSKKDIVESAPIISATSIEDAALVIEEAPAARSPSPTYDAAAQTLSDADWLRSRTSRTLGLVADEDIDMGVPPTRPQADVNMNAYSKDEDAEIGSPEPEVVEAAEFENESEAPERDLAAETVQKTGRLFIRNLYYSVVEGDIQALFAPFGSLAEVHLPIDPKTQKPKGFAYVMFTNPEEAVKALQELDQTIFQGRTLHILPGEAKREQKLDDFAISKLPLKKQRELQKKRAAAKSDFEWNSLYMNIDAVMNSMANRLGVDKAVLLDPTSSDAAVKQAHAETHIIQETKTYFENHGVDLSSFSKKQRGDKAILIKNFPFGTKIEELRTALAEFGDVSRVLMPPAGTIAIAEFTTDPGGRAAFAKLYGRKFKDSVLKIEKAPKDLFIQKFDASKKDDSRSSTLLSAKESRSANDLKQLSETTPTGPTTSLFIKNLNFATTSDSLKFLFSPLEGFILARVTTKPDAKHPGQTLSMGYGFAEFHTREQANAARDAMNNYSLEGHKLDIKASHRGEDAAGAKRGEREAKAKAEASKRTKIIIKNLAFEVSEKQVRQLFSQYGKLRSVRMPKKFNRSTRGFAFAEFVSIWEAENAMEALRHTHLHGRPLVLEWAKEDAKDAEEEIQRLQKKVGRQVDSVKLASLTGAAGRKKFDITGLNGEVDEPL